MPVLTCHELTKTYGAGPLAETALAGLTLRFDQGQTCLLLGPSGSGKTTLLSIFGCLLSPSSGEVVIDDQPVRYTDLKQLTDLRRRKIGFVFQHAQLLPFLTVVENLRIVARNAGLSRHAISQRIPALMERLGIAPYGHRRPAELSGGQRQRAAIARAVLHHPLIILADEPTAALDWENGQIAVRLLIEQAKAEAALLLVVSHDTRLAGMFDSVLYLDSGKVGKP